MHNMKKLAAVLFLVAVVYNTASAQRGQNEIRLVAEGALAFPEVHAGWGGFVKGYYGIGRSAQLTAMLGMSKFSRNEAVGKDKTITHLIPVLIGWKQHIKMFYVEPQAGLGEMGGKVDWGGDYSRPSVTTVFAGLGAGVDVNRFEIGARYQYSKGIDAPAAGIWSRRKFQFAGIHVGYRIF